MNATETAKATQITMRNGFESAIISIDSEMRDLPHFILDENGKPVGVDMVPARVWIVTVVGFYATSHGANVGDTREHSFGDETEARAYANRWFASLKAKGYSRTA